ncbi:F-box/FBD/LRR-repeat protein At5g22700-like [Trifolium pratense]|uniref:F-box/FBD/LRR-repeat protein At5g22700-like n=1 Tax=Trifolium pratense TaxID=57577 RepID=UPI001E6919DF|nr:F-box/FBD/LRR-repeat protein At5g22700-like [Trifolium pratense]
MPSISTANRIDDLPDSILCHILSFLPTKQAATTSVLSKRWKPVWLLVPALDFDDETFKDFGKFHNFIRSTFTLRDKNDAIHSFKFKCGRCNMANKKRLTKLPPHIFNFKMLQVLTLTNMQAFHFDQVDFPHLKTLHLNSVHFISHEYIMKFLLGCPILENLQSGLYLSGIKDNIIENLNALSNLVKVRIFGLNTPMALVCKTKILHMEEV